MNVGFFLHFDFTLDGMLFNELRCYNTIFNNPKIDKIYIFDYKGKYSNMCKDFDFEYTRVIVSSDKDVEKFKKVDMLFTWDWYQDFFAGVISPKAIEIYKIMSKVTNDYGIKSYFRICDVKHFMKDYKQMILDRMSDDESGRKFIERNKDFIHLLDDTPRMNFDNVYFLCNGSRSVSDWSSITLTHSMPFLEEAYVKEHTVYLSDDTLFRYEECYDNMQHLEKNSVDEKIHELYHIGNLNGGKVKQIKNVMKSSKNKLFLRTAKRSLNNGLKSIESIELVEVPKYRDDVYEEINKYKAYLFVGKGDVVSYYFNKTLYDANIGRTVFLIYGKIDEGNIYHELSEYVFNNTEELRTKFEFVCNLSNLEYKAHLDTQRAILIKNLSTESLKLFDI